jgi:hypothetical protein
VDGSEGSVVFLVVIIIRRHEDVYIVLIIVGARVSHSNMYGLGDVRFDYVPFIVPLFRVCFSGTSGGG